MSKVLVSVRALTSFAHGSVDAHRGREYKFSKGDAEELRKAGFVELVEETEAVPEARGTSDEDLLGDDAEEKEAATHDNKMADEHEDKAAATKKTKAK